jgi:hypothetical protein
MSDKGAADAWLVQVYTDWRLLSSCSATKGQLHEIMLGLYGGSVMSGIFYSSQVNIIYSRKESRFLDKMR